MAGSRSSMLLLAMMGYEEPELLGKHYLELIRADVRAKAQQFYRSSCWLRFPARTMNFPP